MYQGNAVVRARVVSMREQLSAVCQSDSVKHRIKTRMFMRVNGANGANGATLLSFVVLVLALAQRASGANVFQAYRVGQFDQGGRHLGSRRVAVNHIAMSANAVLGEEAAISVSVPVPVSDADTDADANGNGERREKVPVSGKSSEDVSRRLVVLRADRLSAASLQHLVDEAKAVSILIVLPAEDTASPGALSDEQMQHWRELEAYMVQRKFDIPIYFCFDSAVVSEMVATLDASTTDGSVDRYQLVVSGSEATPITTVMVNNMHGWLHNSHSATVDVDRVPTILLVANYDTFSAVPQLALGADQNGSGVVALLEIARIFSRLYADVKTHGTYKLLFVLTGAGRINFSGIKHYLDDVDTRVLESVRLALCLDTLASGNELFLHVSKPEKTAEVRSIYNAFRAVAKDMDIPFKVKQRKIDLAHPTRKFQHELFSLKRILAGTLSSVGQSSRVASIPGLIDTRARVDTDVLVRNIRFVGEVLVRIVYGVAQQEKPSGVMLDGSHSVNRDFVSSWLDFVSSQPRMTPYLSKKSLIVTQLEQALKDYLVDVDKSTFALSSDYMFYSSEPLTMNAYKVKPPMFDALLALGTVSFLALLHVTVRYISSGKLF